MTTTDARPAATAEEILDRVTALAPAIAARAAEVEAARTLPTDLVDQLVEAGCFRLFLPESHGGAAADLTSGLRVLEQLSRADASVGWTAMIGTASWFNLAGLPRSTFASVFAAGPDVVGAGVFRPSGTARPVDGGYRVDGRWSFASGCAHADWFFANCAEDGALAPLTVLLWPDQVTVEDTWYAAGLCGTGSHHVRVEDVFVPAERTARAFVDPPNLDTPIVRIPLPSLFAPLTACVALGAARGALDDILGLAPDTVPLMSATTLAGDPLFQHDLARAVIELDAARTLLHAAADDAWSAAVAGVPLTLEQRARIRSASSWAAARAAAVVETAYHAGGGAALYTDSPHQRRLRDVHAVTQHHLIRPSALVTAGAVLLDQEADLTLF